jgi:hypothetical protein
MSEDKLTKSQQILYEILIEVLANKYLEIYKLYEAKGIFKEVRDE